MLLRFQRREKEERKSTKQTIFALGEPTDRVKCNRTCQIPEPPPALP